MARPLHPSRLVALALLASITAACGGGAATAAPPDGGLPSNAAATMAPAGTDAADTGAPAAAVRACDLLSDADIEELTGSTVVEKLDNVLDTTYANHCRWNLKAGEINLGVVAPGGRTFYDERIGFINGLEPVEGLDAEIATLQDLTGSIFAVKNDVLVDIFTIGIVAPDVDIVARVLENLDR